jgi:hypothetical protein
MIVGRLPRLPRRAHLKRAAKWAGLALAAVALGRALRA